ncbi:hypothetical protein [Alsobacter sp. R-9]
MRHVAKLLLLAAAPALTGCSEVIEDIRTQGTTAGYKRCYDKLIAQTLSAVSARAFCVSKHEAPLKNVELGGNASFGFIGTFSGQLFNKSKDYVVTEYFVGVRSIDPPIADFKTLNGWIEPQRSELFTLSEISKEWNEIENSKKNFTWTATANKGIRVSD